MPGERQKGKKNSSVWLDEAEQELARSLEIELGVSRTELFKIATEFLKRHNEPNVSVDDIVRTVKAKTQESKRVGRGGKKA